MPECAAPDRPAPSPVDSRGFDQREGQSPGKYQTPHDVLDSNLEKKSIYARYEIIAQEVMNNQ